MSLLRALQLLVTVTVTLSHSPLLPHLSCNPGGLLPEEALLAWCGLTWPLSLQHTGQRGNHDSIHRGVQSPAPCLVPSRCAVCSLVQPMTMKPQYKVLHLLKTQNPLRSE